jgi:predicted nucleic acid-binding protein
MARILVDSDVLVDHLRGHARFVAGRDEVHVSTINRAELFAGRSTDEARVRLLLTAMTEIPVDAAIAERAGRIRRASQARLLDALVAATAIEHGLILVTRKPRDFAPIRGLRVRAQTGGTSPTS